MTIGVISSPQRVGDVQIVRLGFAAEFLCKRLVGIEIESAPPYAWVVGASLFGFVKHGKIRIRGMVHHQRLPFLVHHLAVPKPALELLRFSLLHKFPVDRGIIF